MRAAVRSGSARSLAVLLLLLAALLAPARGAAAGASLGGLEDAFRGAIGPTLAATVVCLPEGVRGERAGFSSGVIVSADGLVLSDGDAGLVRREGDEPLRRASRVEVRVPVGTTGGYRAYAGAVVARDVGSDTSLIRLEGVPAGGLPHVALGASRDLLVGDFVFAVGSATEGEEEVVPAATWGVVASVARDPAAGASADAAYRAIYTTAAVNPGVNGGPVVDAAGRLVGTVSTYVDPSAADEPYQFLGKAIPLDRALDALGDGPDARRLRGLKLAGRGPRTAEAQALERVVRRAGLRAAPWVVSLSVERAAPLSARSPLGRDEVAPPRHSGPVSGVVVGSDGWIVTSLYNLTNVAPLVEPLWRAPPADAFDAGLAAVERIVVHRRGGPSVPARLVGHDARIGVALLRAELPAGSPPWPTFDPAPSESYESGRFVVAVGNPFGAVPNPDPLLGFGILGKRHPDDASGPWRGEWQSDLGATDANCGGAVVDLEGRFLGMLTIWSGAQHGRNSGISFVVPWGRIQRALPDLRAGRSPAHGRLGVTFERGAPARIVQVAPGSSAEGAGLVAGDVVLAVDRERTANATEVLDILGRRWGGDRVRLRILRAGAARTVDVALGGAPTRVR